MRAAEAYDVRARRMFGGMGVYTGEKMFAFLLGDDIGLKLSPDDLSEAMTIPGAGVLRPEPTAEPLHGYVRMPREVLDNFDKFSSWVDKSACYARRKVVRCEPEPVGPVDS